MKMTLALTMALGGIMSSAAPAEDGPELPRARLYQESLRPQFHITARYWEDYSLNPGPHREGWINDINGLVYHDGEYHFFAQRWWSCWLHAVSTDLVHWEELKPAFGKGGKFGGTQSGGAVVDLHNTSGLADGQEPVMVAFWSSTDNLSQCISYSRDKGRTWVKYDKNPVLVHPQRDPTVFWYEPGNKWIMILYGTEPGEHANRGVYGFNGESNDAHDLLGYAAGEWQYSVVRLHEDGRVVVSDQDHTAEKNIDIQRQKISGDAFYVGSKAGTSEFLHGDVAMILVYRRALTDDETRRVIRGLQSRWDPAASTASAQFDLPTDGLVLHLDATRAQATDDAGVLRWEDLSGHHNHLKQTVPARMPKRMDRALGDLPAIHFDGGQFLQGPAVLAEGDDSFTLVAVWRRDHLDASEVVCEQNAPDAHPGRRAALLAQGSPQEPPGCFLLFASTNLLDWEKLDSSVPDMYECPDMFPLPVDGDREREKWVVIDGNGDALVGRFDGDRFQSETPKMKGDYGRNFYATRSFVGMPESDDRRIQMAWMRGGEYPDMPFNQQISFPCELTLRTLPTGIRLCRYPIQEIERLYAKEFELNDFVLKPGENPLSTITGELFDISADIELSQSDCDEIIFNVRGSLVTYRVKDKILESCATQAELEPRSGGIHLRMLVDRMSVETFGNHGEVSMTNVAQARPANPPLSLRAVGGRAHLRSLVVHEVKSAWPSPGLERPETVSVPIPGNS